LTPADFVTNSDGYLIVKDTENTVDEEILFVGDADGNAMATNIGNTNPDWNIGFTSNFRYKGFGLYFVVEHQQGGDIYNYTKQLLYFNDRHQDNADYGAAGKHADYSGPAGKIYNAGGASSHFVEDGTFTKVREISLTYNIGGSKLGQIGESIENIKIGISGRNLFTITNYSGWDPEVAIGQNPTNFRFDEYSYPNFRTFSAQLALTF